MIERIEMKPTIRNTAFAEAWIKVVIVFPLLGVVCYNAASCLHYVGTLVNTSDKPEEMMGDLAKLPEGQALTEQQAVFVTVMLAGGSGEEARDQAGYSPTTLPQHVLRSATVQAALKAGCDAKLKGELRVKAIQTLETLMDSGPAATKFNAAKLILEHGDAAAGDSGKPLQAMTEEELMGVIERAQAAVDEGREARMLDVTPKNGA